MQAEIGFTSHLAPDWGKNSLIHKTCTRLTNAFLSFSLNKQTCLRIVYIGVCYMFVKMTCIYKCVCVCVDLIAFVFEILSSSCQVTDSTIINCMTSTFMTWRKDITQCHFTAHCMALINMSTAYTQSSTCARSCKTCWLPLLCLF